MYSTILSVLLEPHSTAFSTAQFRFWAKRMFRLVSTPHANIVAHENRPVAVKDQIYNILVGCHGDAAHGGRDKTSAQVRRYYSWIPKELVSRFVKMCPLCIAKRKSQKPYFGDSLLPAVPIARPAAQPASVHDYAERGAPAVAANLLGYGNLHHPQASYPLSMRSQSGDSYCSIDVEGAELDYAVFDPSHGQEVYEYPVYETHEDDQSRPYTGYSDSSSLSATPHSPLRPHLGQLPPNPYYQPHSTEHDYSVGASEQQQHLHFYSEGNFTGMEPASDYELAVWEATEQATGGGGSFALDPPLSYALPTPMLELDSQHAPFDDDWEEGNSAEQPFDPTLQHLQHEPASYVPVQIPEQLHSRRAMKPPPLDLSKTFNLYSPSGASSPFNAHNVRQCATGVPTYLAQPRDTSGPYSAPLENPFGHTIPSPGPSSACSTYSLASATSSSSNGLSMPLTPGSSYSGGIEHLHLAPGSGDDWQQSSKDLAFAIQNLIDATHVKSDGTEEGIRVDDVVERADRQRTRTRTVSASGFLSPHPGGPPTLERRGSATYGALEKDVLNRSPRKEERFSPYQRA